MDGTLDTIIARWRDASGEGLQHLVLQTDAHSIVAEAAALAVEDGKRFACRFRITCDPSWHTRSVEVELIGDSRRIVLASDGAGLWRDSDGLPMPLLDGAIDVDLTVTPFTNTLPIRRLGLRAGESAELRMAYVLLPEFEVTTNRQRYTCLEPMRRYRYESMQSDFTREIEVDAHGLVESYPGLFERVP
jgi:hypothetical protein